MLASVTDPRSPQGIQHILEFVLAVCVVAMLAGAKNYRENRRPCSRHSPAAAEEAGR